MWKVGRLHEPQPDDESFDDERKAIQAASDKATDYNDVIAVWDDRNNVVTIFTADEQFIPA